MHLSQIIVTDLTEECFRSVTEHVRTFLQWHTTTSQEAREIVQVYTLIKSLWCLTSWLALQLYNSELIMKACFFTAVVWQLQGLMLYNKKHIGNRNIYIDQAISQCYCRCQKWQKLISKHTLILLILPRNYSQNLRPPPSCGLLINRF